MAAERAAMSGRRSPGTEFATRYRMISLGAPKAALLPRSSISMESLRFSAMSRSWVTSIMPVPSFFSLASRSVSSRLDQESRPAVGSSSTR
ncbi:MAG: hypothetical protein BWY99_02286 [Synergistetes bacterium ADurb.BinA166]|nr:MAG: hypothetical protein BWY99_02286 [Synergistetes bacterium ADurb.BinA166]